MGRDRDACSDDASSDTCFNPRARMGRDRRSTADASRVGVSIHAPAWGATATVATVFVDAKQFQSTRPHGARRLRGLSSDLPITVSIHAPAWGATECIELPASIAMFQSTRPHGARLTIREQCRNGCQVSIHAPAWGATCTSDYAATRHGMFQSTRPHGARHGRST